MKMKNEELRIEKKQLVNLSTCQLVNLLNYEL